MSISSSKELRHLRRVPGDTIGELRLSNELLGSFSATVLDISIEGVGLIVDSEHAIGSTYLVASKAKGTLPKPLIAIVRHSTPTTGNRWLLGCSFYRSLTVADFEIIG